MRGGLIDEPERVWMDRERIGAIRAVLAWVALVVMLSGFVVAGLWVYMIVRANTVTVVDDG
jgi:hypothetical protein